MGEVGQHWTYDILKKIAEDEQCDQSFLEELMDMFEVQSVRRRECITNIPELLDYLERRDQLSEHNVDPLQEIAEHCGNELLLKSLNQYVTSKEISSVNPVNQYQEERLANALLSTLTFNNPSAVAQSPKAPMPSPYPAQFDNTKRSVIYKLLGNELGKYWRRFGRELGTSEGAMDEIEERFNDLNSRIHSLLKIFEEDPCHEPRKHVVLICQALDDCQRKDLRRKIENIMCQ